MSSQAQIAANKKNAKKSTGPKTAEGKAKSAQNATKHGLTAATDVIKGESQQEYDAHYRRFIDDLAPRNSIEEFLADRVASLAWRLKRADRIQKEVFIAMVVDINHDPTDNVTKVLIPAGMRSKPYPSTKDPNLTLGCSVRKDFKNNRVLGRLMLYEHRLQNSFFKCLNTLQHRKRRKTLTPESESSPSLSRPTSRDLSNPRQEPTRTHTSGTSQKKQTQCLQDEHTVTSAPLNNYSEKPPSAGRLNETTQSQSDPLPSTGGAPQTAPRPRYRTIVRRY